MTRIASYVFIDLETTSLPQLEHNKTRITELSMVVVKRKHILETRPGASPRVQHKLTMCFYPRRMIDPGSTETTGLDNELLEHETVFNIEVFNTINSFLQCLQKPVCLVAQNGHGFDFPILKNHFEKLNVSLSEDILCADSLHSFCDIFEADTTTNTSESLDRSNGLGPKETPSTSFVCSSTDNGVIGANTIETSDGHTAYKIHEERLELNVELSKRCKDKKMSDAQAEEQIPAEVLRDFYENDDLLSQNLIQQQNERTPQHNKQQPSRPRECKAKRKLFWGNKPKPKISYKLKDVYGRVLRKPAIEAHRAENDCIMAMEVAVSIAKLFVDWVDNNHSPFTEVKPMRLGVPLGM